MNRQLTNCGLSLLAGTAALVFALGLTTTCAQIDSVFCRPLTLAPADAASSGGDKSVAAKPADDLGSPKALPADPWRIGFDIIGWGPSVSGNIGVAGHQSGVNVSLDTLLGDLKGIAMLGFELRKEKYGFYAQPNWISLQASGNVGPLNATDDLQLWVVDAAGFFQLGKWGQEKPVTLDALVGVRYWNVSDGLTLTGPGGVIHHHHSDSTYLIDPLIGLRAKMYFTRKFSLSLHGDVGGFGVSDQSSQLTWQAIGTFGYDFNRHYTLDLGYRALSTDQPDGKSLDLLLHGAFLALNFHW
jgi:hypothetical protein